MHEALRGKIWYTHLDFQLCLQPVPMFHSGLYPHEGDRLILFWVYGSADANQPSEISPISLMSLHGTQGLSNVDEETHGVFEMVVHS